MRKTSTGPVLRGSGGLGEVGEGEVALFLLREMQPQHGVQPVENQPAELNVRRCLASSGSPVPMLSSSNRPIRRTR